MVSITSTSTAMLSTSTKKCPDNPLHLSPRRCVFTLETSFAGRGDGCRSHSTLLATSATDESHSLRCVGLLDAESGLVAENFARRCNRNSHAARTLGLLTQRASRMIASIDSASNVKQFHTMMIHKISAAPARVLAMSHALS